MDEPLKGRIAIVTGGARGIGRGIALELARAGADVLLADLLDAPLAKTANDVRELGRRAALAKVDVTQPAQLEAMIAQAIGELGGLDILVNCAGVISIHPVSELTEKDWDFVMDVNAKGTFLGCKAALPHLRAQRRGRIINVASIAGKEGFPNLAHYSASKFAVVGFTNALAKEVAREGITVNAICPGIVRTYMWDRLADEWKNAGESVEESWQRHQLTLIPQGRAQTPEDMGRLAVFFATMDNVTGQAVNVDGGFTFH
ncbi:SDR family NAD(P)-dependent oxidoreductase [Paraburkholderia caballeronis]|uniref:SDR family NAD(P)-dependent oxidoreductase n=1 Tax=Paraburkholderia caballeronis TaxID=416943 RepID=UPI0010652924|nr:SDR family NAD(P)-dependent oxidoreductase [Paraburkholderia caballeronis]TDV17205.1 meso-butanediol dehydrogenase/(S,S)-butanediol dehydrogenase/diacetyl reductase [Paraburkholderia caballeronis]TDV17590.1 meso-butanediol dehydrogenase/(S,S)-butanediol dehydrogenase/diacetyl reductase [Paraburkholderia caballeronis]TDV27608.1 meso-butanediol dehydrogenase/(S,S)-butanediol dehydrogenase/diacetyl reductase [Paraburkholderia caballeronis]